MAATGNSIGTAIEVKVTATIFIVSSDLLIIYNIVLRELHNINSRVIIIYSYSLLELLGELII